MNPSSNPKSARRKSRELALQGLFEWLLSRTDAGAIDAFLRERYPTIKLDQEHFRSVFYGCIEQADALDALLQPYLDRPCAELSPVEHALLLLGAFEMRALPEVPYKVIINEAVELAKVYGGTDGFKYVNGVLDRLAPELRPLETGDRTPAPLPKRSSEMPVNPAASIPVSFKPPEGKLSAPRRRSAEPAAAPARDKPAPRPRPATRPEEVDADSAAAQAWSQAGRRKDEA